MAATVSIQETAIVPAKDGAVVRLYISDKPRAEEATAAALVDIRFPIPQGRKAKIALAQLKAVEAAQKVLLELK